MPAYQRLGALRETSVDRYVWKEWYWRADLPSWPCPHCRSGSLAEEAGSGFGEETQSSQYGQRNGDPPDNIQYRATLVLRCSSCQEVVLGIGRILMEYVESQQTFKPALYPVALYPMPPITDISHAGSSALEVLNAESLLWLSPSAACSRLRAAVERLLDELKVPKFARDKGKRRRLTAHARINTLPHKYAHVRDHLFALKWLGNEGTHESALGHQDVLDGLEVLEHVLDVLFNPRDRKVKEIVKAVLRKKGSRWKKRA
jgi:Domain of unknown function (DUF4145)